MMIWNQPIVRSVFSATAGLLGYGGWAYWVNRQEGMELAVNAALTQGGYSFVITLVLSGFMEWFYRYLGVKQVRPYCKSLMVIVVTCCLLYSISWGVNHWAGTPMILLTILPGAIASTIYTVVYVAAISRSSAY